MIGSTGPLSLVGVRELRSGAFISPSVEHAELLVAVRVFLGFRRQRRFIEDQRHLFDALFPRLALKLRPPNDRISLNSAVSPAEV